MSVEAIMTRDVVSASPTDTVRTAMRLLQDLDIRHLPIIDDKQLVGMVSDRDLREFRLPWTMEVQQRGYLESVLETPLARVMNGPVISVDVGEDASAAVDAMLEYSVGAVPVVDNHTGELVGIVSYVDVLRLVRSSLE